MGHTVFEDFNRTIIETHNGKKKTRPSDQSSQAQIQTPPSDPSTGDSVYGEVDPQAAVPPVAPTHQGKLILDATVVEQAIRYPTDLSLLNEARKFSEPCLSGCRTQRQYVVC
jgi:hypothetical protein